MPFASTVAAVASHPPDTHSNGAPARPPTHATATDARQQTEHIATSSVVTSAPLPTLSSVPDLSSYSSASAAAHTRHPSSSSSSLVGGLFGTSSRSGSSHHLHDSPDDRSDSAGVDLESASSPLLPGLADLVPAFFGMRTTSSSSSSSAAIAGSANAYGNQQHGNGSGRHSRTSSTVDESGSPVAAAPPRNVKLLNFQRVLSDPQVDLAVLRRMSWGGIPASCRAGVWKLLLGYVPVLAERRQATLVKRRAEYAAYLREFYYMGHEPPTSASRTAQAHGASDAPASDDHSLVGVGYDDSSVHRSELEHEYLKQIRQDVPRTSPAIAFFKDPPVQRSLERILYLFAVRHPASGYVQGINDLATPFWTVFALELYGLDILTTARSPLTDEQYVALEADTFWCMSYLIDGIQDHYTFAQPGIQRMVYRLKELILRIDGNANTTTTAAGSTPAAAAAATVLAKGRSVVASESHVGLHAHLERENVQFLHFAFRWMSCLLMRELKLPLILRLWDSYLSEDGGFSSGFKVLHVYVCAAFLMRWKDDLKRMDFQQLIQFLQKLPTDDWHEQEIESLLATAHVYRELFHAAPQHLA